MIFIVLWGCTCMNAVIWSMMSFYQYKNQKLTQILHTGRYLHCAPFTALAQWLGLPTGNKKCCSFLIYTHFPPLLSPAFGTSKLRQSSKGNVLGGASYLSFGRRPHSLVCFSFALPCPSETPCLDWNAKPPAQRTVVYSSLRHQSFQYNKLCLAFLGLLFFLPHPSSIYPAFVWFFSAGFPSNSSFLPASCSQAFVHSLCRNQSWHPASAARRSVLGVLSLCSHIFILRTKKYWILAEHATRSPPHPQPHPTFFYIRSTAACSNKTDFWEDWRGITWRGPSQSNTFRSERRKFEAKQSVLCSVRAFADPGGSSSRLEHFDFLIDGRMLEAWQ